MLINLNFIQHLHFLLDDINRTSQRIRMTIYKRSFFLKQLFMHFIFYEFFLLYLWAFLHQLLHSIPIWRNIKVLRIYGLFVLLEWKKLRIIFLTFLIRTTEMVRWRDSIKFYMLFRIILIFTWLLELYRTIICWFTFNKIVYFFMLTFFVRLSFCLELSWWLNISF